MLRRFLLIAAVLAPVAACDGSRDKLLADLQSPRPEERALAVKKLAQNSRPEDLVLFTKAAKDLAAIVRGEAAEALGKSQDPRVVDLLGELLEDTDEGVQAKAAMALAAIKSDKSKAYLTLQYGRRGRSTRLAIVQALKSANVPGAMAQVVAAEAKGLWDRNLQALTKGALPERVAAAEELGKSGRAEAVNRLLPLIKDSQVILAAAAVRGLGYAGDRRAVSPIALLLTENFPELRESACDALRRLGDPQPLPILKAVALEKSATSTLATSAIITLARGPETDKALCDIALEGGYAEAMAAGHEMRKRGGCSDAPIQERLARLKEPAQVLGALQAAAALGPTVKAALPKILPLLASTDAQLRLRAIEAIAEIGDTSAGPAVEKLYEQESKNIQALRADWVTVELPRKYEPGFDPSGEPAPANPKDPAVAKVKYDELFKRIRALNEAKAQQAGKVLAQPRPPTELIDDVTEEQLKPLAAILRALGKLQAPGALETLKKHLDDRTQLRTAAYVGLTSLGREGVNLAKAGLLEADRDIQGAVALALVQAGEPGQVAVVDVIHRLSGDRLRLVEALQRSGVSTSAVPVLEQVVKEGGPESALAAGMLGDLKATHAVDVLLKYLDDPNAVARRDVLLALGKIGDPKAAEVVARDLNHDSPDVRSAAAEALASVGSVAQFEALDALKGDYYRRVRESAELALARIGAPGSESHK